MRTKLKKAESSLAECVITSYSIHYTKLYDQLLKAQGFIVLAPLAAAPSGSLWVGYAGDAEIGLDAGAPLTAQVDTILQQLEHRGLI